MNPLNAFSTEQLLQVARQTIHNCNLNLVKGLEIDAVQTNFESIDKRINQVKNNVLSSNLEEAFILLSEMQISYNCFKIIAKPLSSQNEALQKVLVYYRLIISQQHNKLIQEQQHRNKKFTDPTLISKVNDNSLLEMQFENEKNENKIQLLLSDFRKIEKHSISKIENLISELIKLLPIFSYDQLILFSEQFLPNLLKYSKQLTKSQLNLAYTLGQVFVDHAINQSWPIDHLSWRLGMAYLAKAVSIATVNNWDVDIYHQKVHHLILNLALKSPLFGKLKRAIPGDPEKYQELILSMDRLERFCSSSTDQELIKKSYYQALEINNSILTHKFKPFKDADEILNARLNAPILFSTFCTKRYREKINTIRSQFPKSGMRKDQEVGTKLMKDFLKMLIEDAIAIWGPAPCHYDFRVLGSLAKDEGCPYSDLESIILIQDEQERPYFHHLASNSRWRS